MFDKLKDMYQMKKQAEEIQQKLANEQVTGTSRDGHWRVTLNGNQELISLEAPEGSSTKIEIERGIIEAHAQARKGIEDIVRKNITGLF